MRNNRGQSMVEYILLVLVIVVTIRTLVKSELVQSIFGPNGKFTSAIGKQMEHTYQHGYSGPRYQGVIDYGTVNHPGYKNGGESRFFTGTERYGEE